LDPEGLLQTYDDNSSDSGRLIHRSFCKNCGSFIVTTNLTHPQISQMVIVPVGIIEALRDSFVPTQEYYMKRKAAWVENRDGVEEFQGMV
jgi:hypothetical protein